MKLLHINDKDIKIAFELMEGSSILHNTGEYSIESAIHQFNNNHEDSEYYSVAIIYGTGGLHRYYVSQNGTIRFSTFHMGYKDVSKDAEDLGFIID